MEKTIYSTEYEAFRHMLREERERLNLTQVELGEKLGRHQPFVARIEAGQRRLDVVEFLHYLSAMGIEPNDFLERLRTRTSPPFKNLKHQSD